MACANVCAIQTLDRVDVASLRRTLTSLGAVVAEVDEQLRYIWIDNPHRDFCAESVIGKRDDQLIDEVSAQEIMTIKREVLVRKTPISALLEFSRSDGVFYYSFCAYPICEVSGKVETILTVAFDLPSEMPTPFQRPCSDP